MPFSKSPLRTSAPLSVTCGDSSPTGRAKPSGNFFSTAAMLITAPAPGGIQRGIAIPLWLLWVRVHRERGRSEPPLPVRVFGDFLRVEKVTLRSIPATGFRKISVKKAAPLRSNPQPVTAAAPSRKPHSRRAYRQLSHVTCSVPPPSRQTSPSKARLSAPPRSDPVSPAAPGAPPSSP